MQCSFCDDPAAHPATGCVYGPNTLACYACVIRFWAWARVHMRARGKGRGKSVPTDFYGAAGKWPRQR